MSDIAILEILQNATKDAVKQSTVKTLPIKFAGITFVVPDDQKYLEVVMITNNQNNYWGNEKDYRGMFRMILHWPNDGAGAYVPGRALESITRYFVKGRLLQNVQIYDTPNLGSIIEAGSENLFPASMRYQCHK